MGQMQHGGLPKTRLDLKVLPSPQDAGDPAGLSRPSPRSLEERAAAPLADARYNAEVVDDEQRHAAQLGPRPTR